MAPLSDLWTRYRSDPRPPRTAFVLSGGAAMGSLQVGMLRALIEARILPDLVLGCSVGALNGVAIAASPSLASVGMLQDAWLDVVDQDLLPAGLLPSTMQLVRKGESIQSSDVLRGLIDKLLPVRTFEELEIPFQCVATNIDSAAGHWFDSGQLLEPILASASIPAVFPAVEIDGHRYFDGAVIHDVPVARAIELGATEIFVLQVGGIDRPRPVPKRPLDMAVLAYWIARRERVLNELSRIPDDVEVVVVPHGDPVGVRYNDLSHSATLMDMAYQAAREFLSLRADGSIKRHMGPLTAADLNRLAPVGGDPDHEIDPAEEDARVMAAHELFEDAASETPTRGESVGPAMRALVERVRLSGDRAMSRVRSLRDGLVAEDVDAPPTTDAASDQPVIDDPGSDTAAKDQAEAPPLATEISDPNGTSHESDLDA